MGDRSRAGSSHNLSKLASCRPRRRASEPRSGVARCSGSCAQGSLNSLNSYSSPVRKSTADIRKGQRASEPRSGVARCSGSSAQGSLNSSNSSSSPVRKNAADIRKVQPHMNNHALPVPLPSQVFEWSHPYTLNLIP